MRELAKRGGKIWYLLVMIPITFIIKFVSFIIHFESDLIIIMQLFSLTLQIFGVIMCTLYPKEVFKY